MLISDFWDKLFDLVSISFPKSKSFGFAFSFNQLNTWVVLIFLMILETGFSSDESKLLYTWFLGIFLIGILMKYSLNAFAIRWSWEITLSFSIKLILEVLSALSVKKGLSDCLQTKWLWIRIPLQSLKRTGGLNAVLRFRFKQTCNVWWNFGYEYIFESNDKLIYTTIAVSKIWCTEKWRIFA